MNTKDTIAVWGCVICSNVTAPIQNWMLAIVMSAVWLCFACVILYFGRGTKSTAAQGDAL